MDDTELDRIESTYGRGAFVAVSFELPGVIRRLVAEIRAQRLLNRMESQVPIAKPTEECHDPDVVVGAGGGEWQPATPRQKAIASMPDPAAHQFVGEDGVFRYWGVPCIPVFIGGVWPGAMSPPRKDW